MTAPGGFLARLAARASGGGAVDAVARPRLPSRFEDVRGSAGPPEEVSAEQRIAGPASVVAVPTTSIAEPRSVPVSAPEPRREVATVIAERAVDQPTDAPRSEAEPVAASPRPEHDIARAVEVTSLERIERVETPVVRARPVASGPEPAALRAVLPRIAAIAASPPEPEPVVRVTIGRVEVRANLTAAAPAPPPPRPSSRDDAVSLHDYLRGRSGTDAR